MEMGRWEQICDGNLDERGQMILVKPPCVFRVTSQKEEKVEEKHEGKTYVKKNYIYNFCICICFVCVCIYIILLFL